MKSKGLGRGLDALLDSDESAPAAQGTLSSLKVGRLQRGKYQPRTRMDEKALNELAQIALHGPGG